MPELLDDFGDPDRSPRAGFIARLAHWLMPVAVATVALAIVDDLGDGWLHPLTAWIGWALVGVYFTAIFHGHLARLCLRCMESVPADAPVRAQRRRLLLWCDHNWLLLTAVVVALILARSGVEALIGHPAPGWTLVPNDLMMLAIVTAWWTHHRLRPWCPWCKRWDEDGGPHEHVPNPDPAGVKTA